MSSIDSITRAAAAVVIAVSTFTASAAPGPLGFGMDLPLAPNSAKDSMLTVDNISGIVQGVLGTRVTPRILPSGDTVLVEGNQLYVPEAQNMRVLNFQISLYRTLSVAGKKVTANVCGRGAFLWRAGPSERDAVSSIKEAVAARTQDFINECMK